MLWIVDLSWETQVLPAGGQETCVLCHLGLPHFSSWIREVEDGERQEMYKGHQRCLWHRKTTGAVDQQPFVEAADWKMG